MLDRASVLRTAIGDGTARTPRLSRRRMIAGSGAAAACVTALLAGTEFLRSRPERIETAVGEIRRVPLKDGSMVAVNTATTLAVELKPEVRQIKVSAGEAWFQVAKDRARPFIVEAGAVRVRAVGTAFSVRRMGSGADVQVTEGVVEVWSVENEANRRRIPAGARSFVNDSSGPRQIDEAELEIDRNLAWRAGQLVFDGETLGEAAAEFNRYNKVQLKIDDPLLARERCVGRFRTNEPDAFARSAAVILGARAQIGPDEIRLSRS
jgi:transmembrane sensor